MESRRAAPNGQSRAKGPAVDLRASNARHGAGGASGGGLVRRDAPLSGATFLPPEDDYPRDLFGEAISPGHGRRGRPRHVPTAETRAKVAQLHQAGAKQLVIASALGITIPTLLLNYPSEMESASRAWCKRQGKNHG